MPCVSSIALVSNSAGMLHATRDARLGWCPWTWYLRYMRLGFFALGCLFAISACSGAEQDPRPEDGSSAKLPESEQDSPEGESPGESLDCSTLKSTGRALGDVAPDLVLKDGSGNDVHLHDYCNETVILIASEF